MKFLKFYLIMVWCFGILNSANTQSITVKGSVINSLENAPVENHLVSFTLPPLEVIFTTFTDNEGDFLMDFEYDPVDSFYVEVTTLDPCSGNDLKAFVFPEFENNNVEFRVCEDSIIIENCMAAFEYYNGTYDDSVYWDVDSTEIDNNTFYFFDLSFGNINYWEWDFGDGTSSNEQNPVHTYQEDGEFLVSLTISGDSCKSSITLPVWVGNFEPECQAMFEYYMDNWMDSINFEDSSINHNTVHFIDYSYGSINSWYWDFGDGTSSNEQNPIHTYTQDGEYEVSLTITGNNCESTTSMMVWIYNYDPDCMAIFGYDYFNWNDSSYRDSSDMDLMTLYFYDFSFGDPSSWTWDFGDGNSSTLQNPKHTYTEAGSYWVSLNIANETCESSFSMEVFAGTYMDTIWEPENCMAMFYPIIHEDLSVEFINESYGEGELFYFWNFGDGNTSVESSPIHNYSEEGEYLISLLIESTDSCVAIFEMYLNLYTNNYNDSLTAFFIPEIEGKTVTFHDKSEGDIWNRYWDFGDGSSSSVSEPVHIYEDLGIYTVTLGVGNAEAVNTYTVEINLLDGSYIGYFGGNGNTDIENSNNFTAFETFPVPMQNELNVSFNSNETTKASIRIYSITGLLIFEKNTSINSGFNETKLNVENLNSGIYLLQIYSNQKIIFNKKLVK